jgi:hypothetical protein
LNREGKLIRIISSDKRGNKYLIEEYIDSDIYIPIKGDVNQVKVEEVKENNNNNNDNNNNNNIDDEIKIIKSKLAIEKLQLELLLLENKKKVTNNLNIIKVISKDAPNPVGPYSQGININNFLFVSGCIGMNPNTNSLVVGGYYYYYYYYIIDIDDYIDLYNSYNK